MTVNTGIVLNDVADAATTQESDAGRSLTLAYDQIIGRTPTPAELTPFWPRRDMQSRPSARFIRTWSAAP